jgi:hypothetical protein
MRDVWHGVQTFNIHADGHLCFTGSRPVMEKEEWASAER